MAEGRGVTFPPLNSRQQKALSKALGAMVALANPLDYHTYIWRDTKAMTRAWTAMVDPDLALTMLVIDYPRAAVCDASDWQCATDAALAVRQETGANIAVVATLPELMPEDTARDLLAGGILPIGGLDEALGAIAAGCACRTPVETPLLLPGAGRELALVSEADAKARLAGFGLVVPRRNTGSDPTGLHFPVVLKGLGVAHKSEAGLVALGLNSAAEVARAAARMDADAFLVEEMITGGVAELLLGINRDAAHGFVLTLAAGGTQTELLSDSASLLVPASRGAVEAALKHLRMAPLLVGYRGAPGANISAILDAVEALQAYVLANADRVGEIEINPLICTPKRAVAVDIMLREAPDEQSDQNPPQRRGV